MIYKFKIKTFEQCNYGKTLKRGKVSRVEQKSNIIEFEFHLNFHPSYYLRFSSTP